MRYFRIMQRFAAGICWRRSFFSGIAVFAQKSDSTQKQL